MVELILNFLVIMLWIWLLLINVTAAIVVVIDKHLSKKTRGSVRRVPEKSFVRFSMLGGGFGTLGAMLIIRHKTKSHDFLLLKIAFFALLWAVAIILILKYF